MDTICHQTRSQPLNFNGKTVYEITAWFVIFFSKLLHAPTLPKLYLVPTHNISCILGHHVHNNEKEWILNKPVKVKLSGDKNIAILGKSDILGFIQYT